MNKTALQHRLLLGVQKCSVVLVMVAMLFTDLGHLLTFNIIPEIPAAEAAVAPAIRVESFDRDVDTDGSTFSLNNDVGATTSAFIRLNSGTRKTSAGPTGLTSNTAPHIGAVGLVLTDTNEVTIERSNATVVKVMGEVWRYTGNAGAANEFIVRDRISVSLSGTSVVTPISGITDADNVVPFITGYTVNDTDINNWEAATIAAHMDDADNLVVSRNNAGTAATVYVDVVEFTGSNWTVCHGYSNAHDSAEQTITLNTDSDGQGGSTCDVGDWSTAAIIEATMEGDSSETGLSDTLALVRPGANTTSVVFDLQQDAAAANDGQAWIHVLQNDGLVVNRASNASIAEGNGTYGTATWPAGATTTAALSTLALEWFTDTSGVGTAHMRGGLHARITDGLTYSDGDLVASTDYDSTAEAYFESAITFAATPSGVVYEAGGTGTGAFVGFNDAGDFIVRAGDGSATAPTNAARIVVTPSDYDFSGRTGILYWNFYPDTESVDMSFDNGSNGSIDYSTSTTAIDPWDNWSGGDDGYVGNSNGNVAGSEITSGYDFNGTIAEVQFSQSDTPEISHWVHRSGNNVGVEYGVIELAGLAAVTESTVVTATGVQRVSADIPQVDQQLGGTFVITENITTRNITSISLTESGSINGQTGLDNIEMYYDLDTTFPYDCASESFSGTTTENQYGTTDDNGFSGPDGASSFSETVSISTTQTFCGYVIYDVTNTAADGDTIEIAIANPSIDVVVSGGGTVGPGSPVSPSGSTTARNAELTQVHYHWLNDDGLEGSATAVEAEDTPATGFANGTINRLRLQVSAEGSTSSAPTTLRLEYATSTGMCTSATGWTEIGSGNAAWSMAPSSQLTDGDDSNDLTPGNGGTTNENTTHLTPNGALLDTNTQTASALTFGTNHFLELEFGIEPSTFAVEGTTYCFRVTDAGAPLRNYDIYPEATVSADITVSATSSQVTSLDAASSNTHLGGGFVIERPGGTRTVTSLTLTENGTIDAQNNLSNIGLWYDLDTSAPYDCTGESFDGNETQFGATSTSFSSANGTTTFSGSETVDSTRTMCPYVVLSVDAEADNGETINIEISNPSVDVIVTGSSVGPSSAVSPTGSTTVAGPILTQYGYHWRNDDGDKSGGVGGATSATGGSENTVLNEVPKNSTRRIRILVHNQGTVDASATQYRIEYGTKVTTCSNVGTWNEVGVGPAFDMSDSTNLTDGETSFDITVSMGGVTNPSGGATYEFTNDGIHDVTSETAGITLEGNELVELEYSIEATDEAGDETTYCFRVSDAGTPLTQYDLYPELTTREQQDFFVQRGTETITATSVTLTAGVDYVAPTATTSAFVRISDAHMTGAADNIGTDGQNADDVTAYISDQSDITSSFTISRPAAATSNTRVDWEIIEFVGLPGTDNEMVVRGVGEVAFSVSEFTDTGATTDTVADDDDVVVFITGQSNHDTGRSEYNDGLFTAAWGSSTSQAILERGDADVTADASYAVVEFTGVNWNVQRVEHTYTAAGAAETESITALGSITRSFIHSQKRVGEGLSSIDEGGHLVYLASIGSVTFELRNTAETPSGHTSVAWVIENTQTGDGEMRVYQSNGELNNADAEPATYITSIGGTINTANASIFGDNTTAGTGTTYPRLHTGFTITSATTYEIYRSDTNNDMEYEVEVVEWPVAEIAVRQNYYRFYVDNDTLAPADPWPVGGTDLGENTSITGANDPLGESERVRIRMSLRVNNATLPAETTSYKLQYARRVTSCSAIVSGNWNDLGAPGSGAIWRGYDASPADGAAVTSSLLTGIPNTVQLGTYEEANNTAVNPASVDVGEDIEYDWHIEHNGAIQQSDYCFRMVESDGTELDGYNHYPTLRTTGYTPVTGDWRWYDDEATVTPTVPAAATNTAPIDIANGEPMKLRVVAEEVEGASGEHVKFRLQFSEQSDFSDGGTFVVASSSCTGTSTWCYADGGGVDNATITAALISTADSCSGGVGDGCGTHNEFPDTPSDFMHFSNTATEFEFTIRSAGPRVNAVYYFRLYDVTNDGPVVASSSYPSVVTEGGSLVFTMDGVTAGEMTEGVMTDVATTPVSVPFGDVQPGTDYIAAYRLNVNTNATEGYQMLMYARQSMTDESGNEIPGVASDNSAPGAWSSVCLPTATGCVGYHAGDDSLSSGSTRFAPDDTYAAFSTSTLEEVMYSSQPAINDTTDIILRLQVSDLQPAGEYQKEIVFVSVPIY